MPDEKCTHIINYLPFFGAVMGDKEISTPFLTRMVETAVMSAVAGGFALYVSVEVLKSEFRHIREDIGSIASEVDEVKVEIKDIRKDLYVPHNRFDRRSKYNEL